MKKTLTINLGGIVFNIDEDAYQLLDKYLSNLRHHFKKEVDADEIIKDIETRISELFSERISGNYQVITIEDVESIIVRVGKPEELANDENADYEESGYSNAQHGDSDAPKKLYRDPDNRLLGGVCSGFAAYMNWDTTVVRLSLFILFLFSYGTFTVIYIILWIIIPLANTAGEKLTMRGKKVTIENIGKTVTDGFEKATNGVNNYIASGKPRNAFQKFADFFVQFIGLLFKLTLVLFAIVCSPILLALAICFIVVIIVAIGLLIGGGVASYSMLSNIHLPAFAVAPSLSVAFAFTGILTVGIPLAALVYSLFSSVFKWKPINTNLKWTLIITWIISLIVTIVCFWKLGVYF